MAKTTFVWVSFSEENLKLHIYQMFRVSLQAQNMVNCCPIVLLDQFYLSSMVHVLHF
jgi:hypothetical protein